MQEKINTNNINNLNNFKELFIYTPIDAQIIAENLKKHPTKMHLIILNDMRACQTLQQNLRFFAPEFNTQIFCDWELLPYDIFNPHTDLIAQRMRLLYAMQQQNFQEVQVIITTTEACLQRLLPPSYLLAHTLIFKVGDVLDIKTWQNNLEQAGYSHVQTVQGTGEYAVRGSIVDIFPTHAAQPYRFELFDEEIEAIKIFDLETQSSLQSVESIELLPTREYDFSANARQLFEQNWQAQQFNKNLGNMPSQIQSALKKGIAFAGIYNYLPLFFNQTATFFDYLPKNSIIYQEKSAFENIQQFWQQVKSSYNFLRHDIDQPALEPQYLYLDQEAYFSAQKSNSKNFQKIDLNYKNNKNDNNNDNNKDNQNNKDNKDNKETYTLSEILNKNININKNNVNINAGFNAQTLKQAIDILQQDFSDYDFVFMAGRIARAEHIAQVLNTTKNIKNKKIEENIKSAEIVKSENPEKSKNSEKNIIDEEKLINKNNEINLNNTTYHLNLHYQQQDIHNKNNQNNKNNNEHNDTNIYIDQSEIFKIFQNLKNEQQQKQQAIILIAVSELTQGFIDHSAKIIYLHENDFNLNAQSGQLGQSAQYLLKFKTSFRLHKNNLNGLDNLNNLNNIHNTNTANQQLQKQYDIQELEAGDPVVHLSHGVGRYQGLSKPAGFTIEINNQTNNQINNDIEFMHIVYANQTDLYVPIEQLHLISKYQGDPEYAPWHSLGSKDWQKNQQKAWQKIHDTAAELLTLYAEREMKKSTALNIDMQEYNKFAAAFPYPETIDQTTAIQAVLNDLQSTKIMDRLICGDVGFGKTEVAMRAAFATILAGKQVVILAPTTLLAEQHFQNITERFSAWPIQAAELSRFKTTKQINEAIQGLEAGKIDIVIATHKVLNAEINFKKLGLVIIDEEHRFGVRQKEQLKHLRKDVHILSMTATPIPRSLGMALDGVRDFSIINTPPQKRLSVKTLIRQEDKSVLREAVLREIKRGGQIFFVHNSVDTIQHKHAYLSEILPEIQIEILHGQMPAKSIEKVMHDFTQQRFQLLLCTTIIETGIDIANANTIIIDKAHKFGLAQLHQLRGRVGRSHHQAYAYLLINEWESLEKNAQKRLEAITKLQDLGSGFALAMQDMEIRGTGEILGDKQSGDIHEMGFGLYTDMLQKTIKKLKKGQVLDLKNYNKHAEIDLNVSAILPSTYIVDVHQRLNFYKLLSQASCLKKTTDEISLAEIKNQMIDRYGLLPDVAQNLFKLHHLRIQVADLGVDKIQFTPQNIHVIFGEGVGDKINHGQFMVFLHGQKNSSFTKGNHLKLDVAALKFEERWQFLQSFLSQVFENYSI